MRLGRASYFSLDAAQARGVLGAVYGAVARWRGHLIRILDVYPAKDGGKRTVMHRTRTLDNVVMIEGELVLILSDSEVTLKQGDVVVQRGTDHAWENRTDKRARAAFFHIDAEFSAELLAKLPKPLELMR